MCSPRIIYSTSRARKRFLTISRRIKAQLFPRIANKKHTPNERMSGRETPAHIDFFFFFLTMNLLMFCMQLALISFKMDGKSAFPFFQKERISYSLAVIIVWKLNIKYIEISCKFIAPSNEKRKTDSCLRMNYKWFSMLNSAILHERFTCSSCCIAKPFGWKCTNRRVCH